MKQLKKLTLTLALLITAAGGAWAEDYTTVFELNGSTANVGKLTLGTSSVETGSVKIHGNTDEIAGIKISANYNYEDGKYFTIAPETGSFKKGDKVSIAVCYNNSGGTKSVKAVIYADDHETLLYTTAEGINGYTANDDPVVEEYVLTQDASVLYIGGNSNDYTFVTTLKVERPASGTPVPVTWDAATKTGTFTMPASNVELTPIYEPEFTAAFKAGNANTIQGGKATVTVTESGATTGTQVTLDENGKLTPLYEGQTITLTAAAGYKFRKVEVEKGAATPSLSLTSPAVSQVIGSDGKNYAANATLPTGVTKVAMIAYVSGDTGLAIALEDESGEMDWNASMTVAAEHTPAFTGGTWRLPSFAYWNNMLNAYNGLSDLNEAIANANGNKMEGKYWSSREDDGEAYYMDFSGPNPTWAMTGKGNPNQKARAVLAF